MLKPVSKVGNIIICPICKTQNFSNAKSCINCGYIFETALIKKKGKHSKKIEQTQAQPEQKEKSSTTSYNILQSEKPLKEADNKLICPICKTEFNSYLLRCPKCGYKIKK
ncbi:MAG: hypothetical protein ACK4J0_02600 [Candidatus Anstonellaceae archaeon]